MKQYSLLVLNTITLGLTLVVNYLSGTGFFSGKTVGEVSAQFDTLITPAGYAFGIWGLIYLLLLAFVAYQWFAWTKNRIDEELVKTGPWFVISNIANSSWIIFWVNGYVGISVLVILLLLISLIVLTLKLRLEIWDAPVRIIAFVWWPICVYLGWVITATVVNIAIYLKDTGWNMFGLSEPFWAVFMIIVAAAIYILLIFTRNMREAAAVGIWALIAIAVKQWNADETIVLTSLIASGVLFLMISFQAYSNRHTLPHRKIVRGEI